jgi:hypothetical protein
VTVPLAKQWARVEEWLDRYADRHAQSGQPFTLADHIGVLSRASGQTVTDVTVLANVNDPFRMDVPNLRARAEWLAGHFNTLVDRPRIHNRGLHYLVLGQIKPDGTVYGENMRPDGRSQKDWDWNWLQDASKAARWLDLIDIDRLLDKRSDVPTLRRWSQPPEPEPSVSLGEALHIPGVDDDLGVAQIEDFEATSDYGPWTRQPYHLIIIGEKSSLYDALAPTARRYQADLYLPTGDISISFVNDMANDIVRDGRPAIIFYVADADPSGWVMPIAFTRKLQAIKLLKPKRFADLDFRVYRAGLTPAQVDASHYPKLDPIALKETEVRDPLPGLAGAVELDAVMAYYPGVLEGIVSEKLDPWFDESLAQRVDDARAEYLDEAEEALDEFLGEQGRTRRDEITTRLAEIRAEADRLLAEMATLTEDFESPDVDVPEAECDGDEFDDDDDADDLLCNSRWPFLRQVQRLIRSRKREDAGEDGDVGDGFDWDDEDDGDE